MSDTSTGSAIIRERTDADLPGAAAALVEVHASDGYPVEGVDDPEAWLTGPNLLHAWVAELNGRIVGHVAISRPQPDDTAAALLYGSADAAKDHLVILGRLFVVPSGRGHRLGERLVNEATSFAQKGETDLALDVMRKDSAAIRLYEHLGWRRIGEAQHDNGKGDAVPAVCYVYNF